MTPWTGPGTLRSWNSTAWAPEPVGSLGRTGGDYQWWRGQGGYFGEAFKGDRGVTQGDLLSPTIFNVVVDAVVRHCVTMALAEAEKKGERGN